MVEIDGLRFSPMSETDHIPARIKLARRMAVWKPRQRF